MRFGKFVSADACPSGEFRPERGYASPSKTGAFSLGGLRPVKAMRFEAPPSQLRRSHVEPARPHKRPARRARTTARPVAYIYFPQTIHAECGQPYTSEALPRLAALRRGLRGVRRRAVLLAGLDRGAPAREGEDARRRRLARVLRLALQAAEPSAPFVRTTGTYVRMYTAVHVRCAHRTSEITRSCARPRRERRPLAATREKRPQRPSTQGRSCAVSQTRLESDRNQAGCVIGRKVSTTRAPTPLKRESQRGSKLQNFIAATRGPASPAKHVIGTAETLLDARRELAVLAVLALRRQVRENWTRSGEPCISKPSSACCALRPACGLPARTASVSKLLVCERCGKQSLHKFTELPKTRTAPRGPRAACRQARTAASNVFQAARLRAVFQTELPK